MRHLHDLGLQYSVGLYAHQPIVDALTALPRQAWRAALDADGQPRDGAQVADSPATCGPPAAPGPPECASSPAGERPHPEA